MKSRDLKKLIDKHVLLECDPNRPCRGCEKIWDEKVTGKILSVRQGNCVIDRSYLLTDSSRKNCKESIRWYSREIAVTQIISAEESDMVCVIDASKGPIQIAKMLYN